MTRIQLTTFRGRFQNRTPATAAMPSWEITSNTNASVIVPRSIRTATGDETSPMKATMKKPMRARRLAGLKRFAA